MISPFNCEVAGFYYHKEGMETGTYLGFIKSENNPYVLLQSLFTQRKENTLAMFRRT